MKHIFFRFEAAGRVEGGDRSCDIETYSDLEGKIPGSAWVLQKLKKPEFTTAEPPIGIREKQPIKNGFQKKSASGSEEHRLENQKGVFKAPKSHF